MALNVRGKDRYKNPNFQTFCVLICVHAIKKFVFFTLTLHPLRPLKGGMFLSFSLLSSFPFSENQPDKGLISV